MKSIWKWILGILAVVIVLGMLGVAPLLWHQFLPYNEYGGYGMMSGGWGGGRMPMHGGFDGYAPMMYGGFGLGFGGLFGGLIQLGILALIVLGIIWLVRAIARQRELPKEH